MPNNRTIELKIGSIDIQANIIISGIKFELLTAKKSDYGENNLFQVLGEKQLEHIFKLAE